MIYCNIGEWGIKRDKHLRDFSQLDSISAIDKHWTIFDNFIEFEKQTILLRMVSRLPFESIYSMISLGIT